MRTESTRDDSFGGDEPATTDVESETGPTRTDGDVPARGGIDVFDSLLVRQPIRDGETDAVRDLLAEWARDNHDGDVQTLLPVDGVTLVTVFLDRGDFGWRPGDSATDTEAGAGADASDRTNSESFERDERGDAVLWYVEVADDDAPAWTDPDDTIRHASPLFAAGLGDHLADEARVYAHGRDGHQLITHATNPHRQERYAEHVGRPLVAPVAGDELPIPVVVLSVPLKPGLTSSLVSRAVAVGNWFKRFDRVQAAMRDETDTLEEEAMYTESLLLEPVDDRLVLHYYMETEDMDWLWDAFQKSDN